MSMSIVVVEVLDRAAAARYVLGRRTAQGGYCFYRTPEWGVDEPNAPDTLAALESLRLLGIEPPAAATTGAWLQALQRADGSYPTRVIGWAALRGLAALGLRPRGSPAAWLSAWCGSLAAGSATALRDRLLDAARLVDVLQTLAMPIDDRTREAVATLLDHCRDPRGGWARPEADLETTAVGWRLGASDGPTFGDPMASRFAGRCEDPVLGFRMRPDAAATSVGALLGGLRVFSESGLEPSHPEAVGRSLRALQRRDGGLGSRHRAISTLHATWQGLEAAHLLTTGREDRQ